MNILLGVTQYRPAPQSGFTEVLIGWGVELDSLIGYFSVSHVLAWFYFSGDRWQCCYNVKRNLQRNWISWLVWKYSPLQSASMVRNIREMIEPILGLFPLEDKLWIALARYNGYHKKPTIYWSSKLKTWQAGCHGTLDFRQDWLSGRCDQHGVQRSRRRIVY